MPAGLLAVAVGEEAVAVGIVGRGEEGGASRRLPRSRIGLKPIESRSLIWTETVGTTCKT